MKKIVCAFLACMLTATVASAATLTEKLKASIAPGSFRIELLRCDGKGSLEGQTGNAFLHKLSYGQKGSDEYYIEYSFPEYRDRYDSIKSRSNPYIAFVNSELHKELKKERSYTYPEKGKYYVESYVDPAVGYSSVDPLQMLMPYYDPKYLRYDNYEDARPEDLTVVKDGKVYILQKGNETGVYADGTEINGNISDSKTKQLIEERVKKPAIIEQMLLADPNVYEIEFLNKADVIYQAEPYILELWSSKKRSGGQEHKFAFYYDMKGNLRLVMTGEDKIGIGTGLYRVVSFDNLVDEYNFECIPHYALQPLNGKGSAKGAKK